MTACVICPTTSDDPQGWTGWELPQDVHWKSAFTHDGDEPPLPAGRYRSCPVCTAWIPRHRAGALPAVVLQGLHALLGQEHLHPATRRRLHAELVGRIRHLAAQLQPIE